MMPWLLLLLLLCVVLAIFGYRESKRRRDLERATQAMVQQIEAFLQEKRPVEYALDERLSAALQNAIARLQEHSLQHDHLLRQERKRNADFVADFSHQLKTPLAALRLYTELDDPAYRDKQLQLLDRMEELVARLLRLEKLRAGAYTLEYELHALEDLVQAVWQELAPLYPERQLILTGSASLRCDSFWMREALHNILQNTCEQLATDPRIQVDLTTTEASCEVSIEDHGGGVDASTLERLFDRFSRKPGASPQSTGLGLAITQAIVHLHHGTIQAQNTTDGLQVRMTLPILSGYRRWE